MNYRQATKKDFPKIVNFFKLNDSDFVPPLSKRAPSIEQLVEGLFNQGEKFILLEKKGRIVGLLSFTQNPKSKSAHISYLVIHPSYRDKGLGRNLLSECFNLLIGTKTPKVIVETWSTNQKALDLYDKKGFTIKEVFKDDRGKGLDTIVLEEPLEGINIRSCTKK